MTRAGLLESINWLQTRECEARMIQIRLENMDRPFEKRWPWPTEVETWWLAPGMKLNGNPRGR